MKCLLFLILVGLSFACTSKTKNKGISTTSLPDTLESRGLNPSPFLKDSQVNLCFATFHIPKGWRLANDDTLTKVADRTCRVRIHNASGKLIYVENGFGTNGDPSEPHVMPARFRAAYIRNKVDTSDIMFADDPRLPKFRKKSPYRWTYDTIAGYKVKIFYPKEKGNYYFGIYIDSVGNDRDDVAEFSLYTSDLNSQEFEELKKVIRTLRIKPMDD
jgi:hypothetical protein